MCGAILYTFFFCFRNNKSNTQPHTKALAGRQAGANEMELSYKCLNEMPQRQRKPKQQRKVNKIHNIFNRVSWARASALVHTHRYTHHTRMVRCGHFSRSRYNLHDWKRPLFVYEHWTPNTSSAIKGKMKRERERKPWMIIHSELLRFSLSLPLALFPFR